MTKIKFFMASIVMVAALLAGFSTVNAQCVGGCNRNSQPAQEVVFETACSERTSDGQNVGASNMKWTGKVLAANPIYTNGQMDNVFGANKWVVFDESNRDTAAKSVKLRFAGGVYSLSEFYSAYDYHHTITKQRRTRRYSYGTVAYGYQLEGSSIVNWLSVQTDGWHKDPFNGQEWPLYIETYRGSNVICSAFDEAYTFPALYSYLPVPTQMESDQNAFEGYKETLEVPQHLRVAENGVRVKGRWVMRVIQPTGILETQLHIGISIVDRQN